MRAVAILFNIALSLFTVGVLLTEGMPAQAQFVAFSVFALLVPALTALVIVKGGVHRHPRGALLRTAVLCNVVLIGLCWWAFVTQYPAHPAEPGVLPFALLMLLAPVLSVVVLARDLRHRPARVAA